MPNSTQASGDGEERSANDEFMDQFADPYDDDYEDDPPPRTTPGLLPGALIGAGIASLCAIGIYQLAGGGHDKAAPSPHTVTYTQDGPTRTVTAKSSADDQAGESATRTVTLPPETRTVRVVQPGKNKTVTQTVTKDGSAKTETKTETKTTTESEPAKTETTTVTQTDTKTVAPPRHTGGEGQ